MGDFPCFSIMLPPKPVFCDFLIKTALERKYGTMDLAPLHDRAERLAHDEMGAKL